MITLENFQRVLKSLEFINENNIYIKHFDSVDCDLKADFTNRKLIYPTEKGFEVNDGTTSNFEHPENFVVFECVARLFDKGYRPEHIELEPRWSLGHGGKSGKADICVKNKDGSRYLCIIECKTADSEYKKELSNMKNDGGQLFSYWQQSKATKWLVLYASDFDEINEKITSTVATVNCSDDANYIELAKDDKSLKLYRDATTVENLYEVWKETYEQKFLGDILFDEETVAYDIGVLPLKKKRLVDFSRDNKIVNQFEEILRHNNVSDKENAFNRLIALFIAKLYDEKTKSLESEVEFQYKTGTDTYQKMQDRLQKLHHFGMKEFMKEDVFYVADDYVKNLMKNAIGENREQLEAELNETITKLKFYTNNDFAFKDVHNKALFYQNGKILVEMVELFQKYRIIDSNELQLLGDMFEQLLNKGFKQNEGQFFTPIPITCFIWKCLPLRNIIENEEKKEIRYPKIIDYACGAGHFLTEGFREVNETIANLGFKAEKGWERDCLFGIEKDYRLARVSKISMFMHGADNGNVVFGDGLDNHNEKIVIENGQFDILVANPPYSVSAFKNHLELKNNELNLLQYISKDGKEIETLFVERIAQLLKPKGIAAVILPSSILSNSSTSYIKAREEILKNFTLHAIVQFGSKTFGATGTNTVVLYLQKNNEPPVKAEIAKDNVTAIFENDDLNVVSDKEIFDSYCKKIEATKEDYLQFIKAARACEDYTQFKTHAYFGMYAKEFEESTEFKKLKSEKISKAFYDYVLSIEKEKLYYFALIYKQQTLVVTAPSDNAEQETFLGYSWSNRKGDEGIKIKSSTPQNACGLLYNVYDEENSIARFVKDTFLGIYRSEGQLQKYVNSYAFKDMIDFSRTSFDKAIKCNVQIENEELKIESKWPLVKLGEVCDIKIGGTPSRNNAEYFGGENLWVSISEMNGQVIYDTKEKITDKGVKNSNVKLIPKGTTLLSFKLSIGKTAVAGKDLYTNEAIAALIPFDLKKLSNDFLFQYFNGNVLDASSVGKKAFGKSLNSAYLKTEMQIPLPPLDVQKCIVAECEQVDSEYQTAEKEIDVNNKIIADILNKTQGEKRKLGDIYKISSGGTPSRKRIEYWENGNIPWLTTTEVTNGLITKTNEYITEEGLKNSSAKIYPKDSLVIAMYGQGTTRGRTAKLGIETTTNQACAVLYEKLTEFDTDYVWAYLKGQYDNLRRISHGSSQPNLTAADISNFVIPLPPLAKQQEIVSKITALESKITDAKKIMEECPAKKQAILDKWLR